MRRGFRVATLEEVRRFGRSGLEAQKLLPPIRGGAGLSLSNNGAGGTSGTGVTTANSGGASGNAFDVVSIGTGETLTFDNTWVVNPGDLAYKITSAATAAANYVSWTTSLGTLTTNQTLSGRLYYVTSGTPTSSVRLMQVLNGSTVLLTMYQESGAGYMSIHDSAGTLQGTGTATALTANTLFRIEFVLTGIGTASGTAAVTVYSGNTTTVFGTAYSGSAINFGTLAPNTIRYGLTTANASVSSSYYIGSILLTDAGVMPGPESAASSAAVSPFFPRRMPLGV
jgi:hypothetical protein